MPAQPKAILEKVLGTLGFAATVEEHTLDGDLTLDVKTEESGRLIGRQGQTLADLQYIVNRILFQQDQSAPKVMLDVGGYRSQAREALVKKAKDAADKVRRAKCHVPPAIKFQEKWQITLDLLDRSLPGLPHGWIVGDDEFGRASEFRAALRLR